MTMQGTETREIAPLFCRRCGLARPRGGALCDECGDRLEPQGFCGVCNRFWPLPVAASCPKHDLTLDEVHPNEPAAAGAGPWTTVQVYSDSQAAQVPRMRLEAEGIPTFVQGERMGTRSMYPVAVGGVRLEVPASLVADARVILSQTWTAPNDDLDDAWEELGPEPTIRHWALTYAVFGVVSLPIILSIAALLLWGLAAWMR